jgi:probable F420-dependent oxidoreductase
MNNATAAGGDAPVIGVESQSTDRSMPIVDLARAADERGFRSLFVNEHTHIPVDHPRSQYPPGGELPERYARLWDPFVALSFVAATTTLEVGTAICQVGEHDPIVLAKTIASLDQLSGGRFVFGVGFGWLREEFEHHGLPATRRADVVEEKVAAIRALWTEDEAAFEGEFVRFAPSWSWPKPRQRPHPAVLLGAPGRPGNLRRVASWADGWLPMGNWATDDDTGAIVAELRRRWDDAGRDPNALDITAARMTDSADEFLRAHERAVKLGFKRVLLHVSDLPSEVVLPLLDDVADRLLH